MLSVLAFLVVVVLLLFVAPVSLYLVGYLIQRGMDKGSRQTARIRTVSREPAPDRLNA